MVGATATSQVCEAELQLARRSTKRTDVDALDCGSTVGAADAAARWLSLYARFCVERVQTGQCT